MKLIRTIVHIQTEYEEEPSVFLDVEGSIQLPDEDELLIHENVNVRVHERLFEYEETEDGIELSVTLFVSEAVSP